MGRILLEVFPSLAETLGIEGKHEEAVSAQEIAAGFSIRDFLGRLCARYPRFNEFVFNSNDDELSDQTIIFLNGRNLGLIEGLDTRLKDGDTLTLIPFVEGG